MRSAGAAGPTVAGYAVDNLVLCPTAQDAATGNRPIHIACQNGHQSVAKMLIDANADVNAQNNNGLTALHMSVEYDYYWTSQLLLTSGADRTLVSGEVRPAWPGAESFVLSQALRAGPQS